ncbi:NACHT domain-containing protein [Paraburkholderia fungorum]|uniref:NACHT domain-containing protein n=1 Tax=Paraburkholderia fungorum TaxID=134537 RepID=UPI00402BE2D5
MAVETIATAIAGGAVRGLISAVVKPVLTSAFSVYKKSGETVADLFADRFTDYVDEQLRRHAFLNTIVFNNKKPLEDLYLPLTVVKDREMVNAESDVGICLRSFDATFIPHFGRILLTDTAGMGKSTLMKFLFIRCIHEKAAIPVFIELRHLSQSQGILDVMERQLNPKNSKGDDSYFSRERIEQILMKGGLVFLLDGYDEISFKDRESVTKGIKEFIDVYPENKYAITSRPESALHAFSSFHKFTIRPLKLPESFSLIRKYDDNGERGEQLIEKLQHKDLAPIKEFLKNPLLVTLLYRSYEYKSNLPVKTHVFYRQVFDALYDWHDSTKDGYNTREKKSKLDIDSFHRVLRVVGFVSVMRNVVEGDKDTVLSWIRDAKSVCSGIQFSESDFLEDVIRAVPIFVKDGSYYRWAHKSLAEYFAVQYICTEGKLQQEEILEGIRNSGHADRFYNVLAQLYDVDNGAFRKHFLIPLAEEFKKYSASSYKGMDASINVDALNMRKGVAFFGFCFIASSKKISDLDRLLSENKIDRGMHLRAIYALGVNYIVGAYEVDPFMTIASVLGEKRDPCIMSHSKLASGVKLKAKIIGFPRSGFVKIDEDPENILNSPRNFESVTNLIARNSYVIDGKQLQLQLETTPSEVKLVSLAEKLLNDLGES